MQSYIVGIVVARVEMHVAKVDNKWTKLNTVMFQIYTVLSIHPY